MDLQQTLSDYEGYHQHKTNILIHIFCVPIIFVTIVGLLNNIPLPVFIPEGLRAGYFIPLLFLAYMLIYARMYLSSVLVFFACVVIADYLLFRLSGAYYLKVNIILFVVVWLIQFWGHKIEGSFPAAVNKGNTSKYHSPFMALILVIKHIKELCVKEA